MVYKKISKRQKPHRNEIVSARPLIERQENPQTTGQAAAGLKNNYTQIQIQKWPLYTQTT